MNDHDHEHEEALIQLAAESGGSLEAFQRSPWAECEACAEAWEEVCKVAELLDATAEHELRALSGTASPEEEAWAQEMVQTSLGPIARRRPGRGVGWRLGTGLVAAGLIGFLALSTWKRPDPPVDPGERPHLGPEDGLQLLVPREGNGDWSTFEWSYPLPEGGYYSFRVYGEDNLLEPLVDEPQLRSAQWSPPLDMNWPDRILWEVSAFDASGQRLAGSSASLVQSE